MTQPVLQSPGAEVAPEEVENTNALKSSRFIQYKPNVIRGIALRSLPAKVLDPKSLLVLCQDTRAAMSALRAGNARPALVQC